MVSARSATVADLPVVLELVHLKAAFDGVPNSVAATEQTLREGLFSAPPQAEVLLAELDGQVIGMASFHAHYSTFIAKPGIWLDDLFIKDGFRNQSAGEVLMVRLAEICLARGGGRIEWSVAARNESGIRFYERIGATVLQGSTLTRLSEEALQRLARRSQAPDAADHPLTEDTR